MIWRIQINDKAGVFDAVGSALKKGIQELGITTVEEVRFIQVYLLKTDLAQNAVVSICDKLFTDPLIQEYVYAQGPQASPVAGYSAVEVAYHPGVMDPVEESVIKGIHDLGIGEKVQISTRKRYLFKGGFSPDELRLITDRFLYNPTIEYVVKEGRDEGFVTGVAYTFCLEEVPLRRVSSSRLLAISRQRQLFLNVEEMLCIQRHFQGLGREPTDVELETIAQTWSEHCAHKTFRGRIEYKEAGHRSQATGHRPRFKTKIINNLLKSTIMKVTRELAKPWCVSVFEDNSGVIRFDKDFDVCFKVETHNHPSALEPYGGANTGIGGVIRDPLGTGLGAKPVLNTDVFCFGPPDYPYEKLPAGCLHPKRIMKGVVAGVRDYGNRMGIPTANGAVLFDEGFTGNPLVFCGTVGLIPKGKARKQVKPGDLIVVVGGRTGRDGIHGATFSSGELTQESERISGGAVQIGNPIQEKKMVDTLLVARDAGLYRAITDCGAGGLSSAVGEMGSQLGACVDLEKVPLKYQGLSYTEIWISEAQERMVLAVPPEKIDRLLGVFQAEDVEATVIGKFSSDKRLKLYYEGKLVCDLDMEFLHKGIPQITRQAIWKPPQHKEPGLAAKPNLTKALQDTLSQWTVCSKEWVIRQYDHEVQGGSVLKPLVGRDNDGPSDACVFFPYPGAKKALAVGCGINFRYGLLDPYRMAASCIDEALRQIVSVGGELNRICLLDNFCWGNPDKPDRLGGLVRCAQGCYDVAKAYGVVFISGKDSLNNEFQVEGRSYPIPGTLLISALGIIEDATRVVSMDLKRPGNLLYILGFTRDELGGSQYYGFFSRLGAHVPAVFPKESIPIMRGLHVAIQKGLIAACHDCSEGGLAVALAEMSFSGGWGVDVFLSEVPLKGRISHQKREDKILFSESNSRFIVEVPREKKKEFEKLFKHLPIGLIGCVNDSEHFRVYGLKGAPCIEANWKDLKRAWQGPLKDF